MKPTNKFGVDELRRSL